jgi:heme o synthase
MTVHKTIQKIPHYWALTKGLQTFLLLVTGIAGYLSYHQPQFDGIVLLGLIGSLFLAISGSTVINMWYDHDIDAKMHRTCNRPLVSGKITRRETLGLGLILSILGISWALWLDVAYGLVIVAGLIFDAVIYTFWLKRRTCWSIVWGGLAGGMPVLAGRVLAAGQIDGIGILLSLAILFWIPTHTLTFSIHFYKDYLAAGVPTFPSKYGFETTHKVIALSSIIAAFTMISGVILIGLTAGLLRLVVVLSAGLLFLALTSIIRPSERLDFGLFKYASLYMLSAMLLIASSGL